MIFAKRSSYAAAITASLIPLMIAAVLSVVPAGCGTRSSDGRTPAGSGAGSNAAPSEPLISAPKHPGAIYIAMSQAYLNRGVQLMEAEAYAAAVQSFSDALAADPGNAMIYYLRASAQLRRQNMQEAIADLSMAIRAGGKPTYLLSRCGAYFVTGAWHAAIADCTDTIGMAPMEADAYLLRAMARFSTGDTDRALTDALVVLMIRPGDGNARNLVEEVIAERERRERGLTTTPMIKTGIEGEIRT